jgi:hypothetical protein
VTQTYLPPLREMPPSLVQRKRAELEEFILTQQQPSRRRWWRRRGFLGGVGAVTLLAVGGGTALAYTYLRPRPVTVRSQARCYTVAAYTGSAVFPGTSIANASSITHVGSVESALQVCAAMWRAGILQAGAASPIVHPGQPFYPVPALVGCTLPDGAAAIFPGPPQTCERLGLASESPPAVESTQPVTSTVAPASVLPPRSP